MTDHSSNASPAPPHPSCCLLPSSSRHPAVVAQAAPTSSHWLRLPLLLLCLSTSFAVAVPGCCYHCYCCYMWGRVLVVVEGDMQGRCLLVDTASSHTQAQWLDSPATAEAAVLSFRFGTLEGPSAADVPLQHSITSTYNHSSVAAALLQSHGLQRRATAQLTHATRRCSLLMTEQ